MLFIRALLFYVYSDKTSSVPSLRNNSGVCTNWLIVFCTDYLMIKIENFASCNATGRLFHDAPQHRSCHGMAWQIKHFHATKLI
jgi:hypothetical protein